MFIIIPERIDKDEDIEFEEIIEKATIFHVECENPNGTIERFLKSNRGKRPKMYLIMRCPRCKNSSKVLETGEIRIDIVKTAIDEKKRVLEEGELMTKGKVS